MSESNAGMSEIAEMSQEEMASVQKLQDAYAALRAELGKAGVTLEDEWNTSTS